MTVWPSNTQKATAKRVQSVLSFCYPKLKGMAQTVLARCTPKKPQLRVLDRLSLGGKKAISVVTYQGSTILVATCGEQAIAVVQLHPESPFCPATGKGKRSRQSRSWSNRKVRTARSILVRRPC